MAHSLSFLLLASLSVLCALLSNLGIISAFSPGHIRSTGSTIRKIAMPLLKSAFSHSKRKLISRSMASTDVPASFVLNEFLDELKALRGTPELVDRLENLAAKHPGIELNIDLYRAIYPFKLDEFQESGLKSLMSGNNVLVSTPTGSGKTLVGELAIYFALMMGLRVAYTTPLKALSNQKFQDFTARYGGDRVGLLTGDIAINRGAPILIMTTEVFRNMIYDRDSENQLSNLFMVCFDEFHFMNDPDRGTVWEESVISCPPSVRILALSATMGNVAEVKGWISSIHGPTELVISDHRPVPLRYLFALKQGLMPLFRDPNAGPGGTTGVPKVAGKLDAPATINPSIIKLEELALRNAQQRMTRTGRPFKTAKVNPQSMIPQYSDLADELNSLKMLPAIVFIFSRAGCEQSAKMVMGGRTKLLNDDETAYVTQAIAAFARANPEIPVMKSSVQMLRAGVGVHHAGLIPVWKAFIEDLFNANKIKVLFATETLAAGVNMPARTTVISTVTKRINSEVVKLKTSQMLQMAGRAGRRGKDTEGTVVILRNRFEDVRMGHKILTSPVDGIKSHFKTSYGLTVKLLQTKTLEECRALIERGFGAYLLQQRVQKKDKQENLDVDLFRNVLQKYSLKGAREYLKLARRLEKELRNEDFLVQKMIETDSDLVQAIADYMPLGIGLQLRNEESGFFLGDVKWGSNNSNNGLGVLTRNGKLYIVRKEHIRAFAESEIAISAKEAQALLELVSVASEWDDLPVDGCKKPMLVGNYSLDAVASETIAEVADALKAVRDSKAFPVPQLPGSVVRQRVIVQEIEDELRENAISQAGEGDLVLQALRYAAALKDPVAFVNAPGKEGGGSESDVFAWRMFKSVMAVLQQFNALEQDTKATELGQIVGSLSTDNELWLAIVLQQPGVKALNPAELGAVMCAVVVDGYKAANAYFKYPASDKVQAVYGELEQLSWDLKLAQTEANIDFPVHLSREAGGLVESWVNGVSWRELCRDTSLDQGDLCRMLRRTVESLRQLSDAYGLDPYIANIALDAASKMDRYPVADLDSPTIDPATGAPVTAADSSRSTTGVGFGAADGIAVGSGDLSDLGDALDILFEGEDEDEDPQQSAEDRLLDRNADLMRRSRDVILTEEVDGELDDYEIRKRLGLLPGQSPSFSSPERKRSVIDRDGGMRRVSDTDREGGSNGSEDDDDEFIDLDVEEGDLESLIEEITEGKGVSHRKNAKGAEIHGDDERFSEKTQVDGDDDKKEFSILEDDEDN